MKRFLFIATLLLNFFTIRAMQNDSPNELFKAIKEGRLEDVKILSQDYRLINSIDSKKNRPIHAAVNTGRQDIIDIIVGAGARLDYSNDQGKKPVDLTENQDIKVKLENAEYEAQVEGIAAALFPILVVWLGAYFYAS